MFSEAQVLAAADTFIRLGGRMTMPECYADAKRIWPNIHPNSRRVMVKHILANGNV